MVNLTTEEARVLYSVIRANWAPSIGYSAYASGAAKLASAGICCRYCIKPGTIAHRSGELVCEEHV